MGLHLIALVHFLQAAQILTIYHWQSGGANDATLLCDVSTVRLYSRKHSLELQAEH